MTKNEIYDKIRDLELEISDKIIRGEDTHDLEMELLALELKNTGEDDD